MASLPTDVTLTSLIGVEDAVSMFRRAVSRNEKPYAKHMIEYNNELLEQWKEHMLLAMANGAGQVRADVVSETLAIFLEGKSLREIAPHLSQMSWPDEEKVKYWRVFFETNDTLEKLTTAGREVAFYGWKVIVDHIRHWSTCEKLEKVYSSSDPLEWRKASRRHTPLMKGEILPPLIGAPLNGVRGWLSDDMNARQEMIVSLQTRPSIQSMLRR